MLSHKTISFATSKQAKLNVCLGYRKDELLRNYERDLAKLRQAELLVAKKSEQVEELVVSSMYIFSKRAWAIAKELGLSLNKLLPWAIFKLCI